MLSASHLIHFSPGPHEDEEADDDATLTVLLTTALDGVLRTVSSGDMLSARLRIEFAAVVIDFCERASLLGVTPTGHAPLELPKAGYWGSTCGYTDPASDVWYVYSDATTDGETLVIDTPCENLYDCFIWPSAVVGYDPELEDDETPPTIALALDRFEGLDGEAETGVRLPMRLFIIDPNVTGETELADLAYEQAPHFTGGGTTLSVKKSEDDPDPDGPGLFALTWRDIAEAVDDEPGEYEIWWRIYHGGGDMLYTATCSVPDDPETLDTDESATTTLPQTVRDRRNVSLGGGYGLWETTDLLVARVRVDPVPLPFLLSLRDGAVLSKLALGDSGNGYQSRSDVDHLTYGLGRWVGDVDGETVAMSFGGTAVHVAGHQLSSTPVDLRCAGIQPWGEHYALVALCGLETIHLYRKPLIAGSDWSKIWSLGLTYDVWRRARYAISPDGQSLAMYSLTEFGDDDQDVYNGSVLVTDITGETPNFVVIYESPPPVMEATADSTYTYWDSGPECGMFGAEADAYTQDLSQSSQYHLEWDALASIVWSGGELVPLVLPIRLDASRAEEFHRSTTGNCPFPPGITVGSHTITESLTLTVLDVVIQAQSLTFSQPYGTPESIAWWRTKRRLTLRDSDSIYKPQSTPSPAGITVLDLGEVKREFEMGASEYVDTRPDAHARVARWREADGIDPPLMTIEYDDPRWFEDQIELNLSAINDTEAMASLVETAKAIFADVYHNVDDARKSFCITHPDGQWVAHIRPDADNSVTHYGRDEAPGLDISDGIDELLIGTPMTLTRCLIAPDPDSTKPETGACVGGGGIAPGPTPDATELIAAHNAFRAQRGLSQLTAAPELTAAIGAHLAWLKDQDNGISHTGEGGSTILDRAIAAGYEGTAYTSAGENLGLGYKSTAAMMNGWETSPPHYANLIYPDWTEIGVAILPAESGYWWGALFGHREDASE